jgi:DNA-binding GntR family transcriptional regulator
MSNSNGASSNTTIAIDRLRELIFSGQLGAGTDHLESELATRLGMSRTPVREALLRLEAQGLLDVRPRKGVRITPLSPRDMAEVYDVLTELESLAAANAAARGLTDSDLEPLAKTIADMDEALANENREEWAAADDAFHTELVRLAGNDRVRRVVDMMSDQVRRARLVTLYMRPTPTKSNDDHREVMDAIRKGDEDRARKVHRQHRIAAKEIIIALLERHHLNSL